MNEGTTDVLSIKAVRPSSEKINRAVFHPVQPWVAYADRASAVTVWNYEANEVGAVDAGDHFWF
jgi:hypothetical protein